LALFVSVVPKLNPAEPDSVIVPVPKFMVREFAVFEPIESAVKLYVARFNEPFATASDKFGMLNALPRLQLQLTPLTVMLEAIVTPFVVNVSPVELLVNVMLPPYELVNPVAGSVTFPWIASGAVPAQVTFPTSGPAIVSEPQRSCVAVQVTV
jgi:hypothetical protein